MAKRAGRNDQCPCGSGLKYKLCHLDWDRDGIPWDEPALDMTPAGSVAGYQLLPLGERPHPDRWQRWEIPDGIIETRDPLEVFKARAGAFALDSIISLTAGLTRLYWRDRSRFNEEVQVAGLEPGTVFFPFLLRRLATQAIAYRQLPDTETRVIDISWLARAERVLIDVAAVSDRQLRGQPEGGSLAMRLLQSQFHDQLDYQTYVRELWLNLATVERCSARGLDLEIAYRAFFGISYSELAALSFATWALVSEGDDGVVNRDIWNKDNVVRIDAEVIDAFFTLCSRDYDQFQAEAGNSIYTEPGFEPYAFSPLIASPLVLRDSGTYVAPIARDLLERPTRGFPIDILRAVEGSSTGVGIVSEVSGSVYEVYVLKSLQAVLGAGDVRRADEVIGSDTMNCDFMCVEPAGITLVEAKSTRLPLRAEMTKQRSLLTEELRRRRIGHGLAQLQASAERITRDGRTSYQDLPILGLLVIRGDLVPVNTPDFRSILEEIASGELGGPVTIPYVVTNDEGFSSLVRLLATPRSLHEYLSRVAGDRRLRFEDIHNTIQGEITTLPQHPLASMQQDALDALLARFLG
jgi:hypothetical protein